MPTIRLAVPRDFYRAWQSDVFRYTGGAFRSWALVLPLDGDQNSTSGSKRKHAKTAQGKGEVASQSTDEKEMADQHCTL